MNAPVDVTGIQIETERLCLRPWQVSDLADLNEYARVEGVGQMCGWLPHKDLEESRTILNIFLREKKTLALVLKASGKVIGSIGLEECNHCLDIPESLRGRELGYVLNKAYWGQGLMAEAVKAVIAHCFRELKFDWLTCGHFLWNHQSRRVVEKCGFRYLKDVVHRTRFAMEEPTKLYIMDRDDFVFLNMNAHFDAASVILETPRLRLRPIEEGDEEAYCRISGMPEVARFCSRDADVSREVIYNRFQRHLRCGETLALVLKENGAFIGSVALQAREWPQYPIDRDLKGREFGFDLDPGYWGRGLMPEAVRALTEYAFRELGFDFVTAGYFAGNEQSKRVMEKCGFAFLFERELKLSNQQAVTVFTHIRYKEKEYV